MAVVEVVQRGHAEDIDEIIGWFEGYCGDVIPNPDYQRLRPQLYRICGREMPE